MDDELLLAARRARAEVQAGRLRGAALVAQLLTVPAGEREAWVDELLGLPEAPPDGSELPRGAVPYLPAGVDEILAMVLGVPLASADRLVDLGSGLGRVVLLAHLLSGAAGVGIEIQAPLVERARACGAELGLSSVGFVHASAAEVELAGSVFFFYAPFTGEPLRRVLATLEALARRQPIVVCTVGLELGDQPWLQRRATELPSLAVYDSRRSG